MTAPDPLNACDGESLATATTATTHLSLSRRHARRLRDIYRSAGWPCLDAMEVELLAAGYLEPVVHEIKVSRADLLGDLKTRDKRDSYLAVGGQCWYVLGCDGRGRPIAQANEIPEECGVILVESERLQVARNAPRRAAADLPFALWMALAKATPLAAISSLWGDEPSQSLLVEQGVNDPS